MSFECAAGTVQREAGTIYAGNQELPTEGDSAMTRIVQGAFLGKVGRWVCGGAAQPDGGPTYTDLSVALKEIEARLDRR